MCSIFERESTICGGLTESTGGYCIVGVVRAPNPPTLHRVNGAFTASADLTLPQDTHSSTSRGHPHHPGAEGTRGQENPQLFLAWNLGKQRMKTSG